MKIEKVGLEAGQVVPRFAPQGPTKGGEGFLLGVGGDRADRAAEHVGLQQAQGFQQLTAAEQAGFMVAIKLQQQRGDHVDLELAQVMERVLELGVRFLGFGAVRQHLP